MNVTRQKYKDLKLEEISGFLTATGVNAVQLKYDGIWARVVCRDYEASIFSRNEQLKDVQYIPDVFDCTLIGEFMYGSQWSQHPSRKGLVFIFDCVEFLGNDITHLPYYQRYLKAKTALINLAHPKFEFVHTYPADAWTDLLQTHPSYEGLVFRDTDSRYSHPLFRFKRDLILDGYAVAFYEGTGRLTNTLGSIGIAPNPSVPEVFRCGGGFTDAQRQEIWANRPLYLNQPLEVSAKKQFTSGALRHPNFVRWKA